MSLTYHNKKLLIADIEKCICRRDYNGLVCLEYPNRKLIKREEIFSMILNLCMIEFAHKYAKRRFLEVERRRLIGYQFNLNDVTIVITPQFLDEPCGLRAERELRQQLFKPIYIHKTPSCKHLLKKSARQSSLVKLNLMSSSRSLIRKAISAE